MIPFQFAHPLKKITIVIILIFVYSLAKAGVRVAILDSIGKSVMYDIGYANNIQRESTWGHFGSTEAKNSRDFALLSYRRECSLGSSSKLCGNVGLQTGWFRSEYFYHGSEIAKFIGNGMICSVEHRDSCGFNSILFMPMFGLNFKPFDGKVKGKGIRMSLDLGYQGYVPVNYFASASLDSSSYFYATSSFINRIVDSKLYRFSDIPKSRFYVRCGISNTVVTQSKFKAGFRLSYSRNFAIFKSDKMPLRTFLLPYQPRGIEFGIWLTKI